MSEVADRLDEIAGDLYSLRPDEFSEARDAAIKTAREGGDANLARELGKLRKPTQSAWLVNLLWRDERESVEEFLTLGVELSRAQAGAKGSELYELTAQRRQIERALVQRAGILAHEAGVAIGAATEREAQET